MNDRHGPVKLQRATVNWWGRLPKLREDLLKEKGVLVARLLITFD